MTSKAPTYLYRYGILALLVWMAAACVARREKALYNTCSFRDGITRANEVDTSRHLFLFVFTQLGEPDLFTTELDVNGCIWKKNTLLAKGTTMDLWPRKRSGGWVADSAMPGVPVLHCAADSAFGDSLIHILDTLCISDAHGHFAFSFKPVYTQEFVLPPQGRSHVALMYNVQDRFPHLPNRKDTRRLTKAIVQLRYSLNEAGYEPLDNMLDKLLKEHWDTEGRCAAVAGFLQAMEDRMPELHPLLAKSRKSLYSVCRKYSYRPLQFDDRDLYHLAGGNIDTVIAQMRGKH